MRILLDGKPVDSLDDKIVRRIRLSPDRELIEGAVMSAYQIVAVRVRNMQLLFGIAGGVGAAIIVVVLVGAMASGSSDMAVVPPVALVALIAIGAMGVFAIRRREARSREEAPRRVARMAPPGTALRLDAASLSFAGHVTPWPDIAIEAVEIIAQYVSEGSDDYLVDMLLLNVEGRTVVLDSQAITNGRAIVDKALRALDAPWTRPDKGLSKNKPR